MNGVLLTAMIFTVTLIHGEQEWPYNNNYPSIDLGAPHHTIAPCQNPRQRKTYTTFVTRHILKKQFGRESLKEWETYLKKARLCGRKYQSFIEATEDDVIQICRGEGWRVEGASGKEGNLCISESNMSIYDVESTKACKVTNVTHDNRQVIVACDKIGSRCFPVHYEKFKNQKMGNERCE